MTDFNDALTGKFFVPANIYGEIPKFGYYRSATDTHAFGINGVRVGGFPLTVEDTSAVSVLRMGSLNLIDFILEGEVYVNAAFVRAQTALLAQGLRGLYVPGNRVYLLDPNLLEIQLVLDDLHIWATSKPIFYHSNELKGFFQVLYADNVKIEGLSVILDPAVARNALTADGYGGDKYNTRKSAFTIYDSDSCWINDVFVRNCCNAVNLKGYHGGTALGIWKALPPANRIITPMNLASVSQNNDPAMPASLRRAGGFTRIENMEVEHTDFGILYSCVENVTIYGITMRDTTYTDAHPHVIYAAGNIVYDQGTNQIIKDKSNGVCKITRVRDYLNPYDSSGKIRVHDQVMISDWYAENVGAGITLINNDGAFVDGLVVQDLRERQSIVTDDDPDTPEPDPEYQDSRGYGMLTVGCREGVFQNISVYMRGGNRVTQGIYHLDTEGSNQRRNTETGELFFSANCLFRNVFVKTNYANMDQNRDFDVDAFDQSTLTNPEPIFKVGNSHNSIGQGVTFENCKHVDAWGMYPGDMFNFRSGTGHKIIRPVCEGERSLLVVYAESGGHTVYIDPLRIGAYTVDDEGTPPTQFITLGTSVDHPGLSLPLADPSDGLVNKTELTGAATGDPAKISTAGADGTVNLLLSTKGETGTVSTNRLFMPSIYTSDTLPGADGMNGAIAVVEDPADSFIVFSKLGVWHKITTTALTIADETQALLDEGWAPSDEVKFKVDSAIRSMKAVGLWDKILAMWGATSLLNWKDPTVYPMVAQGAAVFSADAYFAGTGTDTDYFTTGLNLSTGGAGIFTQDSASLWRWSLTDFAGDLSADLGTGGNLRIMGRVLNGKVQSRVNTAATIDDAVADSLGLSVVSRTGAAISSIYKDATLLKTLTDNTSSAVDSSELKIGRANAGNASPRQMAFAGVGGGLTATDVAHLHAILNTYLNG
jgi:hypothetical protein